MERVVQSDLKLDNVLWLTINTVFLSSFMLKWTTIRLLPQCHYSNSFARWHSGFNFRWGDREGDGRRDPLPPTSEPALLILKDHNNAKSLKSLSSHTHDSEAGVVRDDNANIFNNYFLLFGRKNDFFIIIMRIISKVSISKLELISILVAHSFIIWLGTCPQYVTA